MTGNTVFAVVQFEYTTRDAKDESLYGLLPAQIAVLTLDQDKQTGALKLVKYRARRCHQGAWALDHLRRQPLALEHASLQRGV